MTTIADPSQTLERVYCINLDRRSDRWKRFAEGVPTDWPFAAPIRVPAIDGKLVKHPDYWTAGGGAGCGRTPQRRRLGRQPLSVAVASSLLSSWLGGCMMVIHSGSW